MGNKNFIGSIGQSYVRENSVEIYGFRDLNRLNLDLLAKLGWMVITLWPRVMKGLYYPWKFSNC